MNHLRYNLALRLRNRLKILRINLRIARILGLSQTMRFLVHRLRKAQIIVLSIQEFSTPVFCRVSGSDKYVLWQIVEERPFDIALQNSPRLIIDGGANIGLASLYFANKYPNAQIIAVEPDPENCALFRKNCSAYPNIELIQGALWPSNSALEITNPTASNWALQVAEVSTPTSRAFKGVTIEEVLARSGKQHIDLLKLDIEGAEEQLFSSGYSDWIGYVKNMMIEIHGQRSREAVFSAIRDQNFTVYTSDDYIFIEE